MSATGLRVYLRGIDLAQLIQRYLNNEFGTLISPLPVDPSLLEEKAQSIVTVKEPNSTVSYQLDIGAGQTFACIGYKIFDKDGRYANLDPTKQYRCMYCLKKIKQNPLGLPIRREETQGKLFFHMVDIICCFNCLISETARRQANSIYAQTLAYAAEIYNKCTGRDFSEVKPASDHRFLKIYNGPLTWDEFHANSITYSQKPGNMYFVPVIEYLEQNP